MAGDIKKLWELCEQDVENCGEREENKWWVWFQPRSPTSRPAGDYFQPANDLS
jgi:hypothetical protein